MGIVARFVVKPTPDRTAVAVFTPSTIAPATIKAALEDVSANFPGSSVAGADVALLPIDGKNDSGYILGTAGVLHFDAKPPPDVLEMAVQAVGQALIARDFGLFPTE